MTISEAREQAYLLIACALPASYIEARGRENVMTPKAIKLRDYLADALLAVYRRGLKDAATTREEPPR